MDTIPHMDIVEKTLGISALKRKTIADNIANYNTPEFKATRLKFDEIWSMDNTTTLKTTDSKHISSTQFSDENELGTVVEKDNESKVREDGNNVNLNFEMVEMIKNNYIFGLGVKTINKEFSMERTAMGKS